MDVVQLINSVYHRRAIWDQSHPDHRNRYVLDKLWEEVANECNNQSVKKVSEKWKNLRDYFRKELKKIPLPRSGDPGEEALKKSSWPHFKSLLFLRDQFLPRSSHSNLLDPDNDTQVSTPSTQMDENDGDYDEDEMDETQGVETQETEPDHTESVTPIQSTPKEPRTILKNRARKRSNQLDAFLEIEKKKLQYLDEKRVAADRGRALPVTDDDKLFFDSLLPHVVKIRPHRKLQFRNEIQNLVQKYAYEEYSNNQSTINVIDLVQSAVFIKEKHILATSANLKFTDGVSTHRPRQGAELDCAKRHYDFQGGKEKSNCSVPEEEKKLKEKQGHGQMGTTENKTLSLIIF
ncbi:unnamed protein product [Acanthoscelides obtectus]|uniref:MADF domain-containing protein n=1 Tax=Acanthoscelides obtectus TaxID=200917 RepID=A0A9P0LM24_ACAOB|nr:unnamed protein product [Acanthoscelides obtectus]CAK1658989.1 hypothetical protein AOBTE_LOCUS21236 [Acanthoscelides obtectus]